MLTLALLVLRPQWHKNTTSVMKMGWCQVNYTLRAWKPADAGYGQTECESNGILTEMYINRMYTLGIHIEVVTDHAPLLPVYNAPNKPKQLRVDQHHTKLLPFRYNVVY